MLFAEAQEALQVGSWSAALLTTIGAFATAWITRLANRDRLEFDASKIELQTKVTKLQEDVQACHMDRVELQAMIEAQGKLIAEQGRQIMELRVALARHTKGEDS